MLTSDTVHCNFMCLAAFGRISSKPIPIIHHICQANTIFIFSPHGRLQGEPVNLREQQDAVEFFMSLFESLDEGLKALGHPQLMGATLGGCFSDQKICQGCPHRYAKEEPFSVFSVDIRNHSSLNESLEQYVKGELLEGADAYHCDKCDKKVRYLMESVCNNAFDQLFVGFFWFHRWLLLSGCAFRSCPKCWPSS